MKRFVISIMCSARDFLSAFIQACPRNSLNDDDDDDEHRERDEEMVYQIGAI